jgi:hypothetical protein
MGRDARRRRAGQAGGVGRGPSEARALAALAGFCRYWHMTPRDVEQLTTAEYRAFVRYAEADLRAQKRANRRR